MLNAKQKFGQYGEARAADYLRRLGYKILCLNNRTPLGEIDIIAKEKDTIVFVEVKTRKTLSYGSARHAVTSRKQEKISKSALFYLKSTGKMNAKARFDVVTIDIAQQDADIEVIKNAFELSHA